MLQSFGWRRLLLDALLLQAEWLNSYGLRELAVADQFVAEF